MRLSFISNRLDEVLETVRKQHPIRKGKTFEIETSVVDEVRERINACEFESLAKLAYSFDLRHILACIEIIAVDKEGDPAKKAAHIAQLRPRDQAILSGWFKLVKSYPNQILENLLKELLTEKGFEALVKHPKISDRMPYWFVSENLARGVLSDYQGSEQKSNFDNYLAEQRLIPENGLYQSAWWMLLLKGKAGDLKREKPARILSEFSKAIKSAVVIKFGQHYLNTLKGRSEWAESILKFVNNKWGEPKPTDNRKDSESRFWQGISDFAREEFRRWLMIKEVESFFEGERADFWRVYVETNQVRDVKNILAGEGFMLDFGRFGVIEFKNVGNAAHIYPESEFKKYWGGAAFWTNTAAHFKNTAKTVRLPSEPGWDGRILHFKNWQDKSKTRINRLLRVK
jgi:hypothetical protein